ncbi:hypothetical protein KDM41_04845 [bacterium]|nr:hypothetical protein [bacterium]
MKTLRIAAVQTRPEFGAVDANVAAALALVPTGCDLAVLPELFATGYQFTSPDEVRTFAEDVTGGGSAPVCERLAQFAGDTGTTVVAGLAERAGDRLFNAAVLVRPDGSRDVYRKVHLFLDEKSLFTPGDLGFPVFAACGTRVGLMICFDWIFPEAARSLALGGAELIGHPSNLLLPWCQAAMVTRAQENMVPIVTANRVGSENRTGRELTFSGRSQIIARLGDRLASLDATETGAAVADVEIVERDKLFTARNDLFGDRRPEAYRF